MYEHQIPPIDLDCGVTLTQYVMVAMWKPYLINCMTKGIHCPVEFPTCDKRSGESLVPVIRLMDAWGNEHRKMFDEMGNVI